MQICLPIKFANCKAANFTAALRFFWLHSARVMDKTMPLSELHTAYARMGARQVVGKLVLLQP